MMAVAAATSGDTRWVRPPGPWRPSKFRLLVASGAPVGAGFSEDFVEPFGFGELLDHGGGGHDHHADRVGDFMAFHDVGCGAQVFDAGIGAGAEEDRVDFDVPQGGAGGKAHVGEGFFGGFFVVFVGEVVG